MATRKPGKNGSRKEGARKREQFWRRVLQEQKESGLSHTEFCKQRELSPHSYFWWKREIPIRDGKSAPRPKRRGSEAGSSSAGGKLVQVQVVEPVSEVDGVTTTFEVVLAGDRVIRVPPDFKRESLKRLIAVLEESC